MLQLHKLHVLLAAAGSYMTSLQCASCRAARTAAHALWMPVNFLGGLLGRLEWVEGGAILEGTM
jgi:hypothetical protein